MIANQVAMLAVLRHTEGTYRASDPYRVCYSFSHTIQNMSDHPWFTGEWKGARILVGRFAGEYSSAAGAYQITHGTWAALRAKLRLNNFGPDAQDDACLELIKQCGALDFVIAGDIERSCALMCGTWASLPGSTSGQPQRGLDDIRVAFAAAGGVVNA